MHNTFISNTRLKLEKNQAKVKQHTEAFATWSLFAFFIHVIIQK